MTDWITKAEAAARPTYEKILIHPFIKELIDGSLPRKKFLYYLNQDSLYLRNYSQVLAHIASRLPEAGQTELFLGFAKDSIAVEQGMHADYLRELPSRRAPMSPSCMLYTSIQRAQGTENVAVEAASVLPCFKVYLDCGRYILDAAGRLDGNPYRAWIETYADECFAVSTERAIDVCNSLAAAASTDVRRRMTEMYALCTRMEWLFWDSAYNLEKWKI